VFDVTSDRSVQLIDALRKLARAGTAGTSWTEHATELDGLVTQMHLVIAGRTKARVVPAALDRANLTWTVRDGMQIGADEADIRLMSVCAT
jgi:hypothetical protein